MRIQHTTLSIFILLSIFSCSRDIKVTINKYSYSDSIVQDFKSSNISLNYLSDVNLCLLSCPSGNLQTDKVVKSINRSILELIAPDYINEPYDSICYHLVRDYIEEMNQITTSHFSYDLDEETEDKDQYDSIAYHFYNNINTDCRIGLGDSIVCYTYNLSSYVGGAHPADLSYAYSYSLLNGNKIHPNLLFTRENKPKMLSRIIDKLIKQNQVSSKEELRGLGIEVLQLTDNILLDKDSITFHYDTYSIAPYAYGEINIKFSYDEISDIFIWTNSKG